jgi:selenocysteine lyase/cysteine desulfurase
LKALPKAPPYLVDACQSVGQLPIDVERLQCTFLAATARKFLRGPRGVGFLYVSDAALEAGRYPLYIDLHGAHWTEPDRFELVRDASRFENWEFAYALVLGLGAAAEYARRVGVEAAGEHAVTLAMRARERLTAVDGVRVLDAGERLCAIVTVEIEGRDARDIVRELRQEAINTSALDRSSAVIDMEAKRAHSALRISPHYYNTMREVDIAVDAVASLAAQRSGRRSS